MTLYDQGTTPPEAPAGYTFWNPVGLQYSMDLPVLITPGVWALAQWPSGLSGTQASKTAVPIVQTFAWGRWGTPLGTMNYSRTGVPGGRPTLSPGYVHRDGTYGPGSPAPTTTPWTPGPMPGVPTT